MKFLHNGKLHQRNSRRGGMLILVLMIFAVSLILISSAMTITLASRNRYYVDAERSQERLTLSCAAETVIDALMTQEITDDQLELMATTNGTSQYKITGANASRLGGVQASSTKGTTIAPGLAGATGTNDTYFTVKKDPDNADDIIMEFSTIIDLTSSDKKAENLRVYLHKKPVTPDPKLCANMATFGEEGSSISIPRLHITATKSYSVFHGNVDIINASGESHVHNTMIFTGKTRPAQGTLFYNDVIFYGPNASIDLSSAGTGNGIQTTGGIYFLGTDFMGNSGTQEVFRTGAGVPAAAPGNQVVSAAGGAYFYKANMTVNGDTLQNGSQGAPYWVVGSGSTVKNNNTSDNSSTKYINDGGTYNNAGGNGTRNGVAAASLTGTDKTTYDSIKEKAAKYLAGDVKAAAEQQVPTTQYMKDTFGDHKNGTMISASQTSLPGGKDYKMSGSYGGGKTLEINLADGDTYIYMPADVTLNDYVIKVSNASDNRLYILLAEGVTLHIGNGSNPYDWKPNSGIISCDSRTGNGDSSKAVTGSQKPACVIAGFGGNLLHVPTQCSVLEAYVSLAGNSTIWYQTGGNRFYGRLEAKNFVFNFKLDNSGSIQGNHLEMADCPGMDEDSAGGEKPLTPHYEVTGYEYYY